MQESQESKDLYILNAERIRLQSQLDMINEKKLSLNKINSIFKYIRKGAFSYIRDRIINIKENKYTINKENVFKDYEISPGKIVVYMALFGKYDIIYEPMYVSDKIDYRIFTDQKVPENSRWKKIDIPEDSFILNLSNRDKNRFFKILPHKFFPEYEYSIYIDSSYQIVTDLLPLIADMDTSILSIHKFKSNQYYEQIKTIWALNRSSKSDINNQIKKYTNEGMPAESGYFWNAIIARRHNSEVCKKIMEDWWYEYYHTSSKRDQVSFPYILWKNKFPISDVKSMGSDIYKNPRFFYRGHLYDDYI